MRMLLLAAAVALLPALPAAAQLGCREPFRPHVPDGDFAAAYEMSVAENEMQLYLQNVDDYMACLRREIAALQQAISDTRAEVQVAKDEWQRALRAYKSR